MSNNNETRWNLPIEQRVEIKLGKEFLESAGNVSNEISKVIMMGLADIGLEPGSTRDLQNRAKEYLRMWHDFANSLYFRTSDSNVKSADKIRTAIDGVNALLRPEGTKTDSAAADKLIQALEERF